MRDDFGLVRSNGDSLSERFIRSSVSIFLATKKHRKAKVFFLLITWRRFQQDLNFLKTISSIVFVLGKRRQRGIGSGWGEALWKWVALELELLEFHFLPQWFQLQKMFPFFRQDEHNKSKWGWGRSVSSNTWNSAPESLLQHQKKKSKNILCDWG
jgi:hypothetical protein